MSEVGLPYKLRADATALSNEDTRTRFAAFADDCLSSDRIFLTREVNICGAYEDELIVPNQGYPITVFLGRWMRYPRDENLWIRTGKPKVGREDIVLSKEIGVRSWFYRAEYEGGKVLCDQVRGRFSLTEVPAATSITLTELVEAAKLATELSAAIDSYRMHF